MHFKLCRSEAYEYISVGLEFSPRLHVPICPRSNSRYFRCEKIRRSVKLTLLRPVERLTTSGVDLFFFRGIFYDAVSVQTVQSHVAR
jgi:hypothetical protein